MPKMTSYSGNPVKCRVCGNEEIEKDFTYYPTFGGLPIIYGACAEHIEEVKKEYDEANNRRYNTNMMSSGS